MLQLFSLVSRVQRVTRRILVPIDIGGRCVLTYGLNALCPIAAGRRNLAQSANASRVKTHIT